MLAAPTKHACQTLTTPLISAMRKISLLEIDLSINDLAKCDTSNFDPQHYFHDLLHRQILADRLAASIPGNINKQKRHPAHVHQMACNRSCDSTERINGSTVVKEASAHC
jgi:hypothetical protein